VKNLLTFTLATAIAASSACLAGAPGSQGPISSRVDFEPQVGHAISTELEFRDETNRTVALGDYLDSQPIVLVFTYYGCSNLCPTVISNLVERLAETPIPAAVRPEVVVLSVDPDDSATLAVRKKLTYLGDQGAVSDHWHFLTGDQLAITRLAQQVGLRYVYDSASHQYAHPAGIVLLTPEGKIANYLFGFDFTPAQLAHELADAAARRTASRLERVLLVCFHNSLLSGAHSATILGALQIFSAATLLGMFVFGIVRLMRKRRRAVPVS